MRFFSIICLIFMSQAMIKAQSISNGFYANKESNEFIFFYNDTLQFRICNKDALGTFSIGEGKYEVNNRGTYHILQTYSMMEQTSTINRFRRNDSLLVIKVLYNDSMPIMSAYVYVNDAKAQEKGSISVSISDKNGVIKLNEEQVNNFINKELVIRIQALGFFTKKMVIMERGYDYVIQSIMPETIPFSVCEKKRKIKISKVNTQDIIVEIWKHTKTRLSKVEECFQCSGFIFDKDIENLLRK